MSSLLCRTFIMMKFGTFSDLQPQNFNRNSTYCGSSGEQQNLHFASINRWCEHCQFQQTHALHGRTSYRSYHPRLLLGLKLFRMGGSVGIAKQIDFHAQFHIIFSSDAIHEAQQLFKTNHGARRSFVDFMENKEAWIDQLEVYERAIKNPVAPDSIWKKFGYKDPSCPVGNSSMSDSACSMPSQGNNTKATDTASVDETVGNSHLFGGHTAASRGTLFEEANLCAVLCFLLLPLYFKSDEFQAWLQSDAWTLIKGKSVKLAQPTSGSFMQEKSHRLRHLLGGMASSFYSIELDLYLADPESSWIEDFKTAFMNLPVTLMVSKVKKAELESTVVFVNNDPLQCMSSKKNRPNKIHTWQNVVGRDMCELCSEDLSPGGARQVETAIFNAKGYKVSITDGKACKLRAVKPVIDGNGDYIYSVAIETPFFGNPKQLQELGMIEQSERHFQQIEDLLTLLPLLVKV